MQLGGSSCIRLGHVFQKIKVGVKSVIILYIVIRTVLNVARKQFSLNHFISC